MTDLTARLMADCDVLFTSGILKLALEASPPADPIGSLNAWRKTADYRVLYEFHYEDTDGAESLITRIPIAGDLEVSEVIDPHAAANCAEETRGGCVVARWNAALRKTDVAVVCTAGPRQRAGARVSKLHGGPPCHRRLAPGLRGRHRGHGIHMRVVDPLLRAAGGSGFTVFLVNARHVKNVPGRSQSRHVQHMQKALTQMNLQLAHVLADVVGETGQKILRAIRVAGERDGQVLAAMKNARVRTSVDEIAKS